MYSSLWSSKPEDLKSILLLVEVMLALSPCTATCECCFSAMKTQKTSLKTNMKETTLTNLLTVKNAEMSIKTFNLDPMIGLWVSSAKTQRHVMGKQTTTSSTCPMNVVQRQLKVLVNNSRRKHKRN